MKKKYVAPETLAIRVDCTSALCDFSVSNDKTTEMGAKEYHTIIDLDEEPKSFLEDEL